jgi:hypothetical protein
VDQNGSDGHAEGTGWSGPDADDSPLDLDPQRLPPWTDRRSVRIEPGGTLEYRAEDWQDSLLVVMEGTIELESRLGSVHPFAPGSILWCQGLPIRLIRSTGTDAAVLVSISRRPRPP